MTANGGIDAVNCNAFYCVNTCWLQCIAAIISTIKNCIAHNGQVFAMAGHFVLRLPHESWLKN